MWGYLLGAGLPLLALGGVLVALRHQLTLVTVTGESMRPAYIPGDRVLVRRARVGQLRLGQVVVVEEPGRGGTWRTPPPRPDACLPARAGRLGPQVPPGKFVVLGDNAARSYDSRQLGYFPGDRLLGVVLRRIR